MPDGGRLTLETEQVLVNGAYAQSHPWAKPGRYVLVTVTDTGTGMARDVVERVFEPFFTTKGPRVGTGLGLAVAYGIVRQHGGMLHCYSEPFVGTTMKVYLPVHARDAADVGTKIEGIVRGGVERVLVAEDDPAVRAVVQRILERAGYEVVVVENGSEACRAATDVEFDLALVDVIMPGMSCKETLERLRVLLPRGRFLLSSGYAPDTNVSALLLSTPCEMLSKPYDPDHLLRAVRRALEG